MVKEGRKMKVFRAFIVVFLYILAVLLQTSYAQEVKFPSFAVDYKPDSAPGERFSKGYGQCVDFVKQSRSDLLDMGKVGTAANMPNVAKEKGFEVNNLPREGSAIVMPDVKIIKTGEITGHVAIVTKVAETKEGLYTLTIRDANAKNDIKYDKDDKIIQGSTVIERTVTYNIKEKKVIDGVLKEQSNIVFIHEKKDAYNAKQKEASEYVTQVSKDLGKELSTEEKKKNTEKLFSGTMSPEQLKITIKSSPAPQPTPTVAKSETTSAKAAHKEQIKDKVEQIKETIKEKASEFIKKQVVSTVLKETLSLPALPVKIIVDAAWPKTALAPSSDASKLRETTGHENVTPVKVEFTQTFDGLFTQSANSPGSQIGTHSATLTDGTRVNVIGDSRAGNFTGSFKGDTVAVPGYTPATHNNSEFSGSSVGKISAIGLKEGDLRGTMTVTVPAGTQTATVSGNITIKTDGSLSMPNYSGPVTVNATGAKVGAMSGEWNQSKTTP